MKTTMPKAIMTTLLGLYLTLVGPSPIEAAKLNTEISTGNKSSTIDLKTSGDLNSKLDLFTRTRITYPYDGKINTFSLVNLRYKLANGLKGVLQVRVPSGANPTVRAGPEYFKKLGDFELYLFNSIELSKTPNLELLTKFAYTPNLKKNLQGIAELETGHNLGEDTNGAKGYQLIGRGRLGVGNKNYHVGIFADTTKPKGTDKFNTNYGIFLRISPK